MLANNSPFIFWISFETIFVKVTSLALLYGNNFFLKLFTVLPRVPYYLTLSVNYNNYA